MFLTDRKLERRIEELEQYRYRDRIELQSFEAAKEEQGVVNPILPVMGDSKRTDLEWYPLQTGETWKGRDRFLWLYKEVQIPAEWKGKKAVGVFDFGNTGGGNNSGFESMVYQIGRAHV